jgi:hypothetical protein
VCGLFKPHSSLKKLKIKIHKTIILPVALYGCETWSLTLWEEHGFKREEVTGGWRSLHNEKLHNLHTSSNIVRVIKLRRKRWGRHVACMGDEKCIQNFGQKT